MGYFAVSFGILGFLHKITADICVTCVHHVCFTCFQRVASAHPIGNMTHWVPMATFGWKSC